MEKGMFEGNRELPGPLCPNLVMSRDLGLGRVYLIIMIFLSHCSQVWLPQNHLGEILKRRRPLM